MKTKVFIMAVLGLLLLSSCSHTFCEPDGDWDPMKWEKLSKELTYDKENNAYIVPAQGGEYVFRCKNYHPWLCWVEIYPYAEWLGLDCDSDDIYNSERIGVFDPDSNFYNYEGGWGEVWCNVHIVKDTIKVSFDSISEGAHCAYIEVTAGDIFDHFKFRQQAQTDSL